VPVELELDRFAVQPPDRARLAEILSELEFYSLVRRVGGVGATGGQAGGRVEEAPALEAAVVHATTAELDLDQPAPPAAPPAGLPGSAQEWIALSDEAPTVTVVDDPDELPALAARLRAAPLVALDTEASAGAPRSAALIGLALAASPTDVWYLPFGHRPAVGELAAPDPVRNLPPLDSFQSAPIAALLRDPAVPKAAHNLKYDWQMLRGAGVELGGAAFDSMLASFVLDPGRRSHAIDTLCLEHLGRPMQTYADVAGKGRAEVPFAEVPVPRAAAYAGCDAATVLALHEFFAPGLAEMRLEPLLRDVELPLVPVLVDMEWEGIAIDPAIFGRLSAELGAELARLEVEIARVAGVELNLNSPRQLAVVLFEQQQLPVLKKTKTGPSTDADVLEQLAALGHELPRLILEYRELQKLKGTYVDALPAVVNAVTGRIHTSFNQGGAATGRLSSSDPNLQNIPVRTPRGEAIRRGFVPAPGCVFLVADYSQIELRLMAHLSGDPAFIEAFRQGGDIHRQTAALIFNLPVERVTPEMRARAKTINFATIYGQGAFALSRQLGIAQDEAKQFISRYFERFAGVRAFLDRQVDLAREQGFVETLFKRRRYIPEIRDRNFNLRASGERNAQNSPLQGSAADLIKLAMVRIHRALRERGLASRMLLQVHDELVFEVPVGEVEVMREVVRREMETVVELRVPLVVDVGVGPNWLDAKR
jgi:DNA polymerase-1